MRDIRGDLQDRVSFLEEQISAAQSDYERAAEQLAQEHQARIGDLQAELEAVTTLLEGEYRRLANAPAEDEQRPPAQRAPQQRAVPKPEYHGEAPAAEAEPREQGEPAQRRPEPAPYRPPASVAAEQGHHPAPAERAARQPSPQPYERRPEPVPQRDAYRRAPAVEAAPVSRPAPQDQREPEARPPAPQVYRRAPIAPQGERGETGAMPSQPQRPPLADFLIRKLSESGAMTLEELSRVAVQEGYFAEGENHDRGVQLTLMNVVKAGFIRQLPNGAFAPATVMDTIRLRRAI